MSTKINTHVFQAAATIYEGLIAHHNNKLPHDPSHAFEARELAEYLFKTAKGDPIFTMCAARLLCGFKNNPGTAHCTRDELLNLSLIAATQLVDAFSQVGLTHAPQHQFVGGYGNVPTAPQMPPPPAPTAYAPPLIPAAPPAPPVEIPDFTTEAGQ